MTRQVQVVHLTEAAKWPEGGIPELTCDDRPDVFAAVWSVTLTPEQRTKTLEWLRRCGEPKARANE